MGVLDFVLGRGRCPRCRKKIPASAAYCPACGAGSRKKYVPCAKCLRAVPMEDRHCRYCNEPIKVPGPGDESREEGKVVVKQGVTIVWQRGEGEVARRIDLEDYKAVLQEGFLVEAGTRALLFVNGKLWQEMGPGRYTMESAETQETPQHATVVLVDAGDINLEIPAEARARDKLRLDILATLSLSIEEPTRFFVNGMKQKEFYTQDALCGDVRDEIETVIRDLAGRYDAEVIARGSEIRREIEAELQRAMLDGLRRLGLSLVRLKVLRADAPELEELHARRADAEVSRRRAEVFQKMRDLKAGEYASEDALAEAIEKVDHGKVLRREEREHFLAGLRENRGFALKKLQLMHELEVERAKRLERADIDAAEELRRMQTRVLVEKQEQELQALRLERARMWNDERIRVKREEARIEAEKKKGEIEALSKLSQEQLEIYLADNPERAKVLIARAQAQGEQKDEMARRVIEAYEKAMGTAERVATGPSRARVDVGVNVGGKPRCPDGHENEPGVRECRQCGRAL